MTPPGRKAPRVVAADHADQVAKIGDVAADAGIRRISMLAWRDLDDPEAGGSEIHASNIAALWAEAGIEVTMRTSYAADRPTVSWRDGYRVIRKAGRYMVFPRAAFSELRGWHGERDGLIEIWNGMPFFSPIWSPVPSVTWIHHVHAEMWQMTLSPRLAALGNTIESRIAPPFYRRTPIVTLSESSKRELVDDLHFKESRVSVVSPGIEPYFTPSGEKSPVPLVVAVGRLVPVKRFGALVDALVRVKDAQPDLRAVIAGDGYEREALQAQVLAHGAEDWISLPGRISEDEKVALYREAWLLAMADATAGWGMTITEAAACGTPAVATRVSGHEDAIDDGVSGLLATGDDELVGAIARVLGDPDLRSRMGEAARARAAHFTWEATARGTLEVLAAEVRRKRS